MRICIIVFISKIWFLADDDSNIMGVCGHLKYDLDYGIEYSFDYPISWSAPVAYIGFYLRGADRVF